MLLSPSSSTGRSSILPLVRDLGSFRFHLRDSSSSIRLLDSSRKLIIESNMAVCRSLNLCEVSTSSLAKGCSVGHIGVGSGRGLPLLVPCMSSAHARKWISSVSHSGMFCLYTIDSSSDSSQQQFAVSTDSLQALNRIALIPQNV